MTDILEKDFKTTILNILKELKGTTAKKLKETKRSLYEK